MLLMLCYLTLSCGTAHAEGKPWPLTWWPSHWEPAWGVPQDFEPYYENSAKNPYPLMGEDKNWNPQNWMGSPEEMEYHVKKFYATDIIRDRGTEDGVPALTVGPNFYHLGFADQSRIVQFMDAAFSMTKEPAGTIYLLDWRSDDVIGTRTPAGLDLY